MAMGGPAVKVVGIYAKSLDTLNVDSPRANYKPSDGQINFQKIQARHGHDGLYTHIMRVAFDPVYGREMSIAQQEERPATRFPLAETTRPHERSENANLVALLGGSYIKPNKVNPFQDTITIYDARDQGKKGGNVPYQAYGRDYRGTYRKKDEDGASTNKSPLKSKISLLYNVASVARAVEQKGKEYFKSFYESHIKKDGTPKQNSDPYENRTGISANIAYLWQKLNDYARGVSGYTPSRVQQQTPAYEGQDTQATTYILPTGYSGTNTRPTSIDEKLMGQEIQVPQDVLDATIADAKKFLRQKRIKDLDPANASGIDLIVLK